MSARDDYPVIAGAQYWGGYDELERALDELDRLRALLHLICPICRCDLRSSACTCETPTVAVRPPQQPPQPHKPEKGTDMAGNVDSGPRWLTTPCCTYGKCDQPADLEAFNTYLCEDCFEKILATLEEPA